MRIFVSSLLLAGALVVGSSHIPAHAVPFPVTSGEAVAAENPVTHVRWYGWGHRRHGWGGGAVAAGAAIGLLAGGAIAASNSYYYGYPYYGAGYGYPYYPAYYARPAYYYPYGGYRPVYYARPYRGYRPAYYYERPYWGYGWFAGSDSYRRAYWRY